MNNVSINIADLVDPNDKDGRTYREINHATSHKFKVNDLVEMDNGTRLFINDLTRDCDGTPMYTMGTYRTDYYISPTLSYGYVDDNMMLIKDGAS